MTITDNIYAVDFSKAEGYAWGRQDAAHDALPPEDFEGRIAATDTEKSAEFAQAFAQHRRAFREERIGMATNLRSAYEKWLRGDTLPTTREYERALDRVAPEMTDSYGHRINPV